MRPLALRLPSSLQTLAAALGLLALLVAAVPVPARAEIAIERVVSPGGIEAWLVEEHALPMVAVEFAFRGGAKLDPDGKAGLATMLSGLLDEGAGDLDSQAFQQRLDDLAVRLSFSADRDAFYGSLQSLSENTEDAFDLLRLALTAPRFDPEPVQRIRAQLLAMLAAAEEDPQAVASKAWFKAAFPDHVYGRPPDGTQETLTAVAREDLVAWMRRHLARDRLEIAVVGDITPEALGRLLDTTFGALPTEAEEVLVPPPAPERPAGRIVIPRDIPQTVIQFGGEGLLREDPDFIPAYVLNYVLGGGGFSSRLMLEVREKRGLAYGIYTYLLPLDLTGLLVGGVATENVNAGETMALVRSVLADVRANGISEAELADAKTYLTGAFPLRFDSNANIAEQLLSFQLDDLGIDYVNERNALIESVSQHDIRRVAKRLLDPSDLLVVMVGEPENLTAADEGL